MTLKKTKVPKTTSTLKDKNSDSMSFTIKSVSDVEFSFFSVGENRLDKKQVTMGINWKANISKTDKSLWIYMMVFFKHAGAAALKNEFYPSEETRNDTIIHFTTKSTYYIDNFDQVITNIRGKKFDTKSDFLKNLLSISIATTRGMLVSKLANTEYAGIIIPPLSSRNINDLFDSSPTDQSKPKKLK
jgi:hypothetical protein